MCGFSGFIGGDFEKSHSEALLREMNSQIAHRGPDAYGEWYDENTQIGLGHRRLSIIDLSAAGAQPMASPSTRYIIAFNGEIYNHVDLRKELEIHYQNWKGHSDTETLLVGFDIWGIQKTLEKIVGMFAFAVWDQQSRSLCLARDRIGEKPLYYGWQKGVFLFGSELKGLKVHPAFQSKLNKEALTLYLRFSNIPAPYSVWENIHKLLPGHCYTIALGHIEGKLTKYWDAQGTLERRKNNNFSINRKDAVVELESLLTQSVQQQMVADVPVGAFLSGGVDSSLIVSIMQRLSSQQVRTYSIGFESSLYNEANYASAVANHLGTKHTEFFVSTADALSLIPKLSFVYDEPFADSSQIPTIFVSQLAKKDVKVVLSGDAGDELFCGYKRYILFNQLWQYINKVPLIMRAMFASRLTKINPATWDKYLSKANIFLPKNLKSASIGLTLNKFFYVFMASSLDNLYLQLISLWQLPNQLLVDNIKEPSVMRFFDCSLDVLDSTEKMMFLDMMHYLPNDILTKVDRAAMSTSLETRIPFLDHRIIEFAWSLPLEYKFFNKQTKWPLRQILYKYVPQSLIDRPKMGFGVPIHDWLQGGLKEWAFDLLNQEKIKSQGLLNAPFIHKKLEEYMSGRATYLGHALWNLLILQSWLEDWT